MLTSQFVAGLVAGEGTFVAYQPRQGNRLKPHRTYWEYRFEVNMAQDEEPLLMKLRDFLKVGKLYRRKQQNERWQATVNYRVFRQRDILEVLIPFFDKHLATKPCKKAKQYLKWRDDFLNYYKARMPVGYGDPCKRKREDSMPHTI